MEIIQRNRKHVSTKVDLTAMVDLGFLLITFFMLATTLGRPTTMEILKPSAEGDPTPYPQSRTATILIGTRDKVYTYALPNVIQSRKDIVMDSTDFTSTGLRRYIQRRQEEVKAKWGDKDKLLVIIKALPGAQYKHLVDVLDEMLISQVKRYAIAEANSPVDSMVVAMAGETWGSRGE